MHFFFSPKSRILVSRPLAVCMNTLNLLGPVLLLCALILLLVAQFGDHPAETRHLVLIAAAVLIATALGIRILWGIAVRVIAARRITPPPA
jgi:hypothetical protein